MLAKYITPLKVQEYYPPQKVRLVLPKPREANFLRQLLTIVFTAAIMTIVELA